MKEEIIILHELQKNNVVKKTKNLGEKKEISTEVSVPTSQHIRLPKLFKKIMQDYSCRKVTRWYCRCAVTSFGVLIILLICGVGGAAIICFVDQNVQCSRFE